MITVVSPHLDDGVFACGALLSASPGSVVITALAGGPPAYEHVTPWDAACGFSDGDDVIAARRSEDREALALLGASPIWLPFRDAQYGGPKAPAELSAALGRAVSAAPGEEVFLPLGLFHSDHRMVSDAALPLVLEGRGRRFYAYEEAMYRRVPGLVDAALGRLAGRGVAAEPCDRAVSAEHLDRKRRAVLCYRSQLRGLTTPGRPGYEDAFAPERFWRLWV
jgi:LmbE family N-acetylglucosaminyl deacetylase